MIGSLIAAAVWVALIAVIRHEARAQREEWGPLLDFAEFQRELRQCD